jgi:adenylate cyclase
MAGGGSVNDEKWRALLEGTNEPLQRLGRLLRRIPSAPRCKMCAAPFGRPGSLVLRPLGWRQSTANRALCDNCAHGLNESRGGAEIDASFLFADIRDSTVLAESLRPAEFQGLLERFYAVCAKAIDQAGGILDKYLGDGVDAIFIPAFARDGSGHAGAAIKAARSIAWALSGAEGREPIPTGVGVHSGLAFVGVLGTEGGELDFTGVGDTVNTAARLGSAAGAGEVLVSLTAASAGGLDVTRLERRSLALKGKSRPVEVVVLAAGETAVQA